MKFKLENRQETEISSREMLINKIKDYTGKESGCNITGRKQAELIGCCGLISYGECLIAVRLCDSGITIKGESLIIRHYHGGRMIISGKISSVEYHIGREDNEL